MAEPESGFDYGGQRYPWSITDTGKDLMLIDRITGLGLIEFYETLDDDAERGRGPILLALIATSIRAARPDWTVERIARTVERLSMSDVEFWGAESEEEEQSGPPSPPATLLPTAEPSKSPANGSSSSSTPAGLTTSDPSFASPG